MYNVASVLCCVHCPSGLKETERGLLLLNAEPGVNETVNVSLASDFCSLTLQRKKFEALVLRSRTPHQDATCLLL